MRVTLIQGVIGLFIIPSLLGFSLYLYNPSEKARNKRDDQRITDLEILKKSIDKYLANNDNKSATMCDVCKLDSDIFAAQSITLKSTNSAKVIDSIAVNVTGWIPIDFSLNAKINKTPISELPLDPTNSEPYVYTYSPGKNGVYKLTASLESVKNDSLEADDGGIDDTRYEIGTDLGLPPQ